MIGMVKLMTAVVVVTHSNTGILATCTYIDMIALDLSLTVDMFHYLHSIHRHTTHTNMNMVFAK